jgi:hyperosmotically inducible periplasmic protein
MNQAKHVRTSLFVALAAALGLAACGDRNDSRTAGQKVDSAVAQTEQRAEQAKDAVKDAGTQVARAVSDTVITTTVKAELAKDSQLSALKIDVDTANGKVALKGTAPNSAARERATQLALAVQGVVSVDNQLTVNNS